MSQCFGRVARKTVARRRRMEPGEARRTRTRALRGLIPDCRKQKVRGRIGVRETRRNLHFAEGRRMKGC